MRTTFVAAAVVGVAAWIGLGSIARGQIIIVDADQFAPGTNLTNAFANVTLSATTDGSGQQAATERVLCSAPPSSTITGTRVMGWDLSGGPAANWNGMTFRARFSQTIAYVSLDFRCVSLGGETMTLQVFDALGTLLDSRQMFVDLGQATTLEISRPGTDIASIAAVGSTGPRMDNLRWSPTVQLPLRPCCFVNGACLLATAASCSAVGGASIGAGPSACSPSPCQQAIGACCAPGGSCVLQTGAACLGAGRRYLGTGTACTALNGTNSCCAADADANGIVGVGDIFRFLTEWFAGCV